MTRTDNPQSRLAALLDTLEWELLAAPADEVRHAWRKTGRARDITCQAVRVLLNEAIAASEEGSDVTQPSDACSGLDRHFGVSQEFRPEKVRCDLSASTAPAWYCRRH